MWIGVSIWSAEAIRRRSCLLWYGHNPITSKREFSHNTLGDGLELARLLLASVVLRDTFVIHVWGFPWQWLAVASHFVASVLLYILLALIYKGNCIMLDAWSKCVFPSCDLQCATMKGRPVLTVRCLRCRAGFNQTVWIIVRGIFSFHLIPNTWWYLNVWMKNLIIGIGRKRMNWILWLCKNIFGRIIAVFFFLLFFPGEIDLIYGFPFFLGRTVLYD